MFTLYFWFAISGSCDPVVWQSSLTSFRTRYSSATAQDFFKLVHQGTLGSEHAVGSGEIAQRRMFEEVASLPAAPEISEGLVEELPPNGQFVRINLRPYIRQRRSIDSLLAAFVRTANSGTMDTSQLDCARSSMPVGSAERSFFDVQKSAGFSAVHHSVAYSNAYRPAYRVISRGEAVRLLGRMLVK